MGESFRGRWAPVFTFVLIAGACSSGNTNPAGEYDPASPLRLAQKAIKGFPRGKLITVPDRSHWGLHGDDCIETIVDDFLSRASVEKLETSCVERYERPAFATPGHATRLLQ